MKNKIRTLLIDEDKKTVSSMQKYFSSSEVIEVKLIAKDGLDALDIAKTNKESIDLVIMDTLLTKLDCLSLLKKFEEVNFNPKIIVTSSFINSLIFDNASELNIDYVFLKPFNFYDLENVISFLFNTKPKEYKTNPNLENRVTRMLHSLGVPSHIKGYQYIRESVMLMYSNPFVVGGITKELYPKVALKFNTTASRVERAIRHAIEVSWNRGDYDYMEELFGNSVDYDRAKPTNSEFIATVTDKLRLDLKSFLR